MLNGNLCAANNNVCIAFRFEYRNLLIIERTTVAQRRRRQKYCLVSNRDDLVNVYFWYEKYANKRNIHTRVMRLYPILNNRNA